MDKKVIILKLFLYLIIIGFTTLVLLNLFNYKIDNIFIQEINKIWVYKDNNIKFFGLFFIFMTISYNLTLPFTYFWTITLGYIINDILKSFTIIFWFLFINSNIYFFIYKIVISKNFIEKINKKYWYYSIIQKDLNDNKLKFSMVVRFLILPTSFKDWIFIFLKLDYFYFIFSAIFYYLFLSIQNTLIGISIKEYNNSKVIIYKNILWFLLILINIVTSIIFSKYIKHVKRKKIEEELTDIN